MVQRGICDFIHFFLLHDRLRTGGVSPGVWLLLQSSWDLRHVYQRIFEQCFRTAKTLSKHILGPGVVLNSVLLCGLYHGALKVLKSSRGLCPRFSLCFSILIISLGEEGAGLCASRTLVCLFCACMFLFFFSSSWCRGLAVWLWQTLDLSINFFAVRCSLPELVIERTHGSRCSLVWLWIKK